MASAPLSVPLIFQSNVGQADSRFPFVLRSVNFAAGFTRTAITAAVLRPSINVEGERGVAMKGNAIALSFKGARPATITGHKALKGSVNSIIGRDRARWQNRIPSFDALRYGGLYPGIQAFVGASSGRLEYGFLAEAGADIKRIRIGVDGVGRLRLDPKGNLVMETSGGSILQTRPHFFERKDGANRNLKGRFVLLGGNEYGFEADGHNPNAQLVIDPEIVFSTYFGGGRNEGFLGTDAGGDDYIGRGFDIALSPNGNIFVTGLTASADFPVTAGGAMEGSADVFVMRVDPTQPPGQQLIYATFIGGSSAERGRSVAPLDDGRVYLTGHTDSNDFPTSSGVVQEARERSGAYVTRLTPEGAFDIGTMLGRTVSHHPNSVVFSKREDEAEGFVYIAGSARPRPGRTGDATPGSFQPTPAGGEFDGFITKLDAELTRFEYFTYLGGTNRDVVMDLDVNDGFAFVTGTTTSTDFPTTELAAQPQHSQASNADVNCAGDAPPRQCFDAFVARVNRAGSGLIYSTYYGTGREEFARGISVSRNSQLGAQNNQVTITGGARAAAPGTLNVMFVTRFDAGGENILWQLLLAGQETDHGEELVVDQFGRAHVVGTVSIDGLATAGDFHGGTGDIFYARVTADGDNDYFTYLGGAGHDRGFAIDAAGANQDNFCASVAGSTTSDDIQTINPLAGGEAPSGRADLQLYTLCDTQVRLDGSNFSKSVSPSTVEPGGTLTFTITVTNDGDTPAPVLITDRVPESVQVTEVDGQGCRLNGNVVTCSFSASPGATSIIITARAGQQCPVSVDNSAILRVSNREFTRRASAQIVCAPPLCSNGRIDPGEQCDDGNVRAGDACRPDCTREECLDGIQDSGEECDDGNHVDNDRCTNRCKIRPGDRDPCTRNGPRCATGVCGIRCSNEPGRCRVSFFGLFCLIQEDDVIFCEVEATCMPADEASVIVQP